MKTLTTFLVSSVLLAGCAFVPGPYGSAPPPHGAAEPATSSGASVEVEAGAEASVDAGEAPVEPGAVDAAVGVPGDPGAVDGAGSGPVEGISTAALCTKAATCTTRISMELCGLFDKDCLDAFHAHLDGSSREGCQEKMARLPALVETYQRPGYVLPPECR